MSHFTRERAAMLAASTAAFGLSALLRKVSIDRINPLVYQVVAASVYVILLPFYIWICLHKSTSESIDTRGVFWAIVATIIASFGGIMFGYALRAGNDAGVVASLSAVSPVITMILSFTLLGERPSAASALGCALVICGVVIISCQK